MTTTSSLASITHCLDAISRQQHAQALNELIEVAKSMVPADAVVLLKHTPIGYQVIAQQGLVAKANGQTFHPSDQPRLAQIAGTSDWCRFDCDSELADPYDDLVVGISGALPVHDCMGVSLQHRGEHWGLLTLDAITSNALANVSDEVLSLLSKLASLTISISESLDQFQRQLSDNDSTELIGESQPIQFLKQQIAALGANDIPVLVTGETGTGKELVVSALHRCSKRSQAPLITLNCATLSKELAASELFGHKKGAFTGATADHIGKFAIADGGTLFLDEVGELDIDVQAQLLRALQTGEYQPVGSNKTKVANVRVIAATHRNLKERIDEGAFREDLYYRLSVFDLRVPTLRERGDDIRLLAEHFARRWLAKLDRPALRLPESLLNRWVNDQWPGNVRQLEHSVARWALGYQNENSALTSSVATEPDTAHSLSLTEATEQYQRTLIQNQLKRHAGNWSATARSLSMDRANLSRLAKRLGIRQ